MKVLSATTAAVVTACATDYRGFATAFSVKTSLPVKTPSSSSALSLSPPASRREILTEAMLGSAVSFATVAGIVAAPFPANAAPKKKKDESGDQPKIPSRSKAASFEGVYTDPKHPKGYRVITSKSMTLSDGGKDAVVYRDIPLKSGKDKNTKEKLLTLDFSAKGGPKKAVGRFADNGNLSYTVSFPDGNVWTKRLTVEGVYKDAKNDKVRAIYKETGAGSNLQTVNLKDGKEGSNPKIFATKLNEKSGKIEFKDFDDAVEIVGSYSKGIITFPDGNYWTKL